MRAPRLRVIHGRRRAAFVALPLAFLAAFYAYPLLITFAAATAEGARWLATPYVTGRLRVALLQAILSVALTFSLAIPLAWLHHARAIRASRLQMALHAAPFVLPVFVVVYGIQLTVGSALPPLAAVVLAHAYYNYGFAARALHAALDRRPRRLEEAARTLGATPAGAFLRVTLPLLLPSALAVAMLVFLFTFASFGTVLFLGGGEVSTPETMMYQQLGGAFPRPERAAALGALQLALSALLFLGYATLARRQRGLEERPAAARAPARASHQAFAAGALLLGLIPMLAVLVGGFQLRGEWSLEPWRALLDANHPGHLAGFDIRRALALTLGYALGATALALLLTALLAYSLPALPPRARSAIETATALPLGTSALLLGLGYALAFGAGAILDLRGTTLVVILVHTLVAFPFAARILLPAFALRDTRLDEAAALLGARPLAIAWRIHLPLLAGPLAAAAGLAAAASLGDFGAGVLLMRPDNMSLAVWIARHDAPFDPLRKAQAIAIASALALTSASLYLTIDRLHHLGKWRL